MTHAQARAIEASQLEGNQVRERGRWRESEGRLGGGLRGGVREKGGG
jgi:hypothetical protein